MKSESIKGQRCLPEAISAKDTGKIHRNILKERIEEYGIDNLMDAEILNLLTGIDVEILRKAIDDFGVLDLIKYINSLDLSKAKKRKMELLHLYYKRMLTSAHKKKLIINSSTKAGEFATTLFTGKAYEAFYVICLDAQNRMNYAALVHEGTINETQVYPRLIIEHAMQYRANSVILAHNHPGGSQQPSNADIDITKRLSMALSAVGIKLVDHIIIADSKYTSLAERGLLAV